MDSRGRMAGIALPVVLVTLVVTLLLALSAAIVVRDSERAARGDRDRTIAMEAAEAALRDAERDIEGDGARRASRNIAFASAGSHGFIAGCGGEGSGGDAAPSPWRGLCAAADVPVWITADLDAPESGAARTVPFGHYTGAQMPTGGPLPLRLPRYLIEALPDRRPGRTADHPVDPTHDSEKSVLYRITAIGFGSRDTTRVVLQTVYRKVGGA